MTTRAAVLAEIESRLVATGVTVERNPAMPGETPATGKIFMGDGDPGEPEVLLSPETHIYTHDVPVEIEAPGATESERLTLCNSILSAIGAQFPEADVDLGGVADEVTVLAPRVKAAGASGIDDYTPEVLIAALTIRVIYTTENSLAV